jgi:hypothetical protein
LLTPTSWEATLVSLLRYSSKALPHSVPLPGTHLLVVEEQGKGEYGSNNRDTGTNQEGEEVVARRVVNNSYKDKVF